MYQVASISVVIPCYCCSDVLVRAVESVFSQTLLPAEIILVDDASPDNEKTKLCIKKIASDFANTYPIEIRTIFLNNNQGPGCARNAGWDIADNDFIAFLDADDTWHPKKLEIQVNWMSTNPKYVLTCHNSILFAQNRDLVLHLDSVPIVCLSLLGLLFRNSIATRSVVIRRDIEHRFPIGIRYAEDYYLWLKILSTGGKAIRLSLDLAYHYRNEFGLGGVSADLRAMHLGALNCINEIYRDRKTNYVIWFLAIYVEKIKYVKRKVITLFRYLMR